MDTFEINFENVSDLQASKFAAELKDFLSGITSDIQLSQVRSNPRSQDAGTIWYKVAC
jgi:hypothetical protein